MSGILGTLGISEAAAERAFVNTIGQSIVYDAVQEELRQHNEELRRVLALFLEGTTSDFKRRYELPGGGFLQPMGHSGVPGAGKASGYWDVAFPLIDFGRQFSGTRVAMAYMSVAQLNRHLDTVFLQDVNTVRREILKALLDSSGYTFKDEIHGNLSVVPLANGDSVVYPPVQGSDTEATENHYIETGYAVASISDTNNPCVTVRDELEEHFGTPTGGSPIVMLATSAICNKIEELSDFDSVPSRFIQPGANTDIPFGAPEGVPGRIRGVCNGIWVAEWRALPANYSITIHADAPKPLMMREDPADTGLAGGLQLVAEDEQYPFRNSFYQHRLGIGVGNRLNGVVLEFGTGGTYSVPTGYSH